MQSNFREKFRNYLELSKIKIMIPVSLTGFTGYFIFDPHLSLRIILISLGILLQAISASILNQLQEVDLDFRMNRTHDRPLPAKKISKTSAIVFFFICMLSGTSILYFSGNLISAIIGLFTIFWYNGIYTYAKRISFLAVVPGSLTGALPPLIGWTAAGGIVLDKTIILVGFLFFIGQIPHFWLLILKYGEEYENAGIPSLTKVLSRSQINRLTFTWVVASVISAIFLCYFEIIQSNLIVSFLLVASFCLIWSFRDMIKGPGNITDYKRNFIYLNSYFLLILIFLIVDRIIK
jgi:protoheme IX farnesyltransferase